MSTHLRELFLSPQERVLDRYDLFGRYHFRYDDRLGPFRPEVSEYLFARGFQPVYPGGKSFAVCVTHDVDLLVDPLRQRVGRVASGLLSRDPRRLGGALARLVGESEYWKDLDRLVEIDASYGVRSTFFFLSLERNERDYNYHPAQVRGLLRSLSSGGFEVGLHGGHTAYLSSVKMRDEKRRLETAAGVEVKGYRNHYLRFRVPETWRHLAASGFAYDSTYAFPDVPGFRNGLCHPFRPLDGDQRTIDILEIPLIVADFVFDKYLRLAPETIWAMIELLTRRTAAVNGVLTVLWHNTYMNEPFQGLYRALLDLGTRLNGWMTGAQALCDWWQSQSYSEACLRLAPEILGEGQRAPG